MSIFSLVGPHCQLPLASFLEKQAVLKGLDDVNGGLSQSYRYSRLER